MGIDLGSILSGLAAGAPGAARGLGNYSQIKFAEKLRQAAEQRAFQERQQLAGEDFARDKELREFVAQLQEAADVRRQGYRDVERTEDAEIRRREQALGFLETKRSRERQEEIDALNRRDVESRIAARERPDGGGVSAPALSVAQTIQIQRDVERERSRLLGAREDAIQAIRRNLRMTPEQQSAAIEKIMLDYSDEVIEQTANSLGERLRGAAGVRPEAAPLDIDALIAEEVGARGGQGLGEGVVPPADTGLPASSRVPISGPQPPPTLASQINDVLETASSPTEIFRFLEEVFGNLYAKPRGMRNGKILFNQ